MREFQKTYLYRVTFKGQYASTPKLKSYYKVGASRREVEEYYNKRISKEYEIKTISCVGDQVSGEEFRPMKK